jgi:REP element-mobilizing transposase RayT
MGEAEESAKHFPHVDLDAFAVVPNHLHGIIVLTDRARGRGEASRASIPG